MNAVVASQRHGLLQALAKTTPAGCGSRRYATLMTGVQPSNQLHLGNYFGAVEFFVRHQQSPALQGERITQRLFSIVDLHSMTVPDRKGLAQSTLESAAMLLAAGIDPDQTILFRQSDVLQHASLMWMLLCRVSVSRLQRMIQWKVLLRYVS